MMPKMTSWVEVVGAKRAQMGIKPAHSPPGPSAFTIFSMQSTKPLYTFALSFMLQVGWGREGKGGGSGAF
jgi:hypothetical protein